MAAISADVEGCRVRPLGLCGEESVVKAEPELTNRLRIAIRDSGSAAKDHEVHFLASMIERSLRKRDARRRLWTKERLMSAKEDILLLILEARDAGDRDEALWRTFLAAHFGRESAHKEKQGQVESPCCLLFAFGSEPKWTWKVVKSSPQMLRRWLFEKREELEKLSFGNHRKYESNRPDLLWEVIWSFLMLVDETGGAPSSLFATAESMTPDERHVELYRRIKPIRRFGRTARFDFLSLLDDLGLVQAESASCHIVGSTGPLEGAKKIWGRDKSPRELGTLADQLAIKLDVPASVMEDALCNWQKGR